jgi:hypothetical protein
MLVLPQTVKVKWHNNTKTRFINKGYVFTKMGDEFEINVLDLPEKSGVSVKVICDFCGNLTSKTYKSYNKTHKKGGDCCPNCKVVKSWLFRTRYTFEDVKKEFEKHNFTLLESNYLGLREKYNYICDKGHTTKITFYHLLRGIGCNKCAIENRSGKNSPNWNFSLTDEEREKDRTSTEGYCIWRLSVYKRDNYTCKCCKKKCKKLIAHHLDGYDWCKEKRIDINNGITLCPDCHYNFHHHYGYGGNTKEQFEEWILKQINLMLKEV